MTQDLAKKIILEKLAGTISVCICESCKANEEKSYFKGYKVIAGYNIL